MADCKVKVCRICFSMDCELHLLHRDVKLYKAYESITELELADEEDLPAYLCTSCADQLMNYVRFRKRSLQAHLMLLDIVKNHGHISVESIQAVLKTTHCDTDIEHTQDKVLNTLKIKKKPEDITEDPIATELGEEIKTDYIPDDVGGPCLCVVETNINLVKEEFDETLVKDNVEDNKVTAGEDVSLDSGLHSGQESKWNTVQEREGTEVLKYQKEDIQQQDAEVNEKLLKNAKLSTELCGYENDSAKQFLSTQTHEETTLRYRYMCDLKTESKKIFLAHMNLYSKNMSHSSNNLEGSYSRISTQINNISKDFSCEFCKKSYCSINTLKRHMRIHTKEKQFSCYICEKSFHQKGTLRRHMSSHTAIRPFSCEICKSSFSEKCNLQRHMLIHNAEKQYSCDVCSKSFGSAVGLKSHVQIHSVNKQYTCDVCNKSYHHKTSLKYHIQTHDRTKRFACHVCKKSFFSNNYLQNHMLMHTGKSQHVCVVCEKSFSEKSNLQRHMLIHTDKKPHCCDVCNKSFRHKSNLQEHILIHTGVKPYKCEVCNKTFRQHGHHKVHLKQHLGHKPFACEICHKKFSRKFVMQKHMLIHS